ncbi:MAG TPA: ATP-binding protein, partial [Candidatus Lustribacter sp.]|nr:ATP-binding protein [Candidatus Lustribacter sp.]
MNERSPGVASSDVDDGQDAAAPAPDDDDPSLHSSSTDPGSDTSSDPERPRTRRIPSAAQSVPMIRADLVDDLRALDVPEPVIDEAELVVCELVSNALRHARPLPDGSIRVHWRAKAGVVELEVTDGGSDTVPCPAPISVWSSTGRGLRIVRSVAHEWGVTGGSAGHTVWASLG